MNSMVRERESHVSRLFIEVTPGIRRALELLAEASITLLDEIDAPVDEMEADSDFEWSAEDDEANGDHEPNIGWTVDGMSIGSNDESEPNLGWTNDGDTTGDDADEDLVAVETSAGFPSRLPIDDAVCSEAKAKFDLRLARRPEPIPREWIEHPNGLRFSPVTWTTATIPTFPHEEPGRPTFYVTEEIRRLRGELIAKRHRRTNRRKSTGSKVRCL